MPDPQLMDLCLWCLGWNGVRDFFCFSLISISINHITLLTQKIREVAMSDSLDDDDRRYRPRNAESQVSTPRDSAYALKTLESMSREDLIRAFVKIQTSFVGGRSRSGGLSSFGDVWRYVVFERLLFHHFLGESLEHKYIFCENIQNI